MGWDPHFCTHGASPLGWGRKKQQHWMSLHQTGLNINETTKTDCRDGHPDFDPLGKMDVSSSLVLAAEHTAQLMLTLKHIHTLMLCSPHTPILHAQKYTPKTLQVHLECTNK